MVRFFTLLLSSFMIWNVAFSQEASAIHEIEKGSLLNEYIIKTIITGLKGVDIARITFKINDVHTYKKALGNEMFSSRDKEQVKFYVMGVPETGIITVEFGVILSDNQAYSFPVEFQYSRNDDKKIVQFPALVFEEEELLASEELVDEVLINKEEPKEVARIKVVEIDSNKEESSLALSIATDDSIVSEIKTIEKEVKAVSTEKIEEKVDLKVEKEVTIKEELVDTKAKYTIQILSLSKFSQARFDAYCKKHSLLEEEVSTRVVNGMTKVIYGKANSLEEAKKLIDKLKFLNNIDSAFAVPL